MANLDHVWRPTPGNKFMTVGDAKKMLAEMAKLEIPDDTLLRVDGVIGWNAEVRGLGIKEKKG
jgi:hypothetical protein